MRRRRLGWCGEKTGCYCFLTSVGSKHFRFVGRCKQTSNIGCGLSSGSQTSLTSYYFLSRSRFYFRFYRASGATLVPRPSSAHDRVTMAEVDSGRLTSVGRVTSGVGSVSRGSRAKTNSLGKSSRPSWLGISVTMTFCRILAIYR